MKIDFYNIYNHCKIPSTYKDNQGFNLGAAIYNLRRTYNEGNLDDEIEQKFNSISGWSWELKKLAKQHGLSQEEQIDLIKRFQFENGHLVAPIDKDTYGIKLGRIISRFRDKYKKDRLEKNNYKK